MLNRIWALRLSGEPGHPAFGVTWHALSLAAVVLLPMYVADLPFWNASAANAAYSLLMAGVYVAVRASPGDHGQPAQRHSRAARARRRRGLLRRCALLPVAAPEPPARRRGGCRRERIGIPLAIAPFVLHRFRAAALACLAVAVAVLLAVVSRPADVAVLRWAVLSGLHPLTLTAYDTLIPTPAMDGGAIAADGGRLLVLTGDGLLYAIAAAADGSVSATRLDVPPPFDRARFLADQPDRTLTQRIRATDLLIAPGSEARRLFAAHQYWHPAERCLTLRVSTIDIDSDSGGAAAGGWTAVFDSSPCLAAADVRDDSETGGSLAWRDGRLLLTVGDHGYDGRTGPAFAQLADNWYGKVIEIDPASGGHRIFSTGHRNPQGLLVDAGGRVWATEHGPSGGDELNLLQDGNNYGWPYATYGADYGTQYWPLAPSAHNHGSFTEPTYAFVPSLAVASIIEVASPLLPRWQGDLLIGSLRTRSLLRVRLRGDRVVYVEPILISREVRDMAEGPDGRLYLWTDDTGDIVTVAPAIGAVTGPAAFVRCGVCHEVGPDGTRGAPSLRGIAGAEVARDPDFSYAPSLAALGGRWTDERLDAFLADPDAVAPGSRMDVGRVVDPAERRAIIEFLKTYR